MENNAPDQTELYNWEEKAVLAAPLTGRLYKHDNITMHNIILRSISDASDAFTYLNPYINKDDVRAYIKALRSRYENIDMQDHYAGEAKRTIETLEYRK